MSRGSDHSSSTSSSSSSSSSRSRLHQSTAASRGHQQPERGLHQASIAIVIVRARAKSADLPVESRQAHRHHEGGDADFFRYARYSRPLLPLSLRHPVLLRFCLDALLLTLAAFHIFFFAFFFASMISISTIIIIIIIIIDKSFIGQRHSFPPSSLSQRRVTDPLLLNVVRLRLRLRLYLLLSLVPLSPFRSLQLGTALPQCSVCVGPRRCCTCLHSSLCQFSHARRHALSHIFSDRVVVGRSVCPRTLVRFRFLPILFVSSVVDRLMWWLFSSSVCLNVTFVAADVATRFRTSDWLSMAAQFL